MSKANSNIKKQKSLLIFIVIVIPVAIFCLSVLNKYLFPHFQTIKQQTSQLPTTAPTISQSVQNPQETIDPQKKLLDLIQNRRPLSQSDINAKKTILSLLPSGQQSGTLYQSAGIIIEYVHSADLFQVEIDKSDIQSEKSSAVEWFEQYGVSKKGICNLPVTFYLNYQLDQELHQRDLSFNPLPDGC